MVNLLQPRTSQLPKCAAAVARIQAVYKERLGNDLPKPIGDESLSLPLSMTYLIGRDGVIAYAYVNAEYCVWTVPEEVFSMLEGTTN